MENDATLKTARHLVLYDGVCGLCNHTVTFILKRDRKSQFNFAPLQSRLGRSLLLEQGHRPDRLDTFYVIIDYNSQHVRWAAGARAMLFIVSQLGGVWRMSTALSLLPDFLLNAGYSVIARNRYRVFGRYDQCLMPTANYKDRFIDLESG